VGEGIECTRNQERGAASLYREFLRPAAYDRQADASSCATRTSGGSAWPLRQAYKLKKTVDPGFVEFSSRKPREKLTAPKRSN
jgi:hypothetical protein